MTGSQHRPSKDILKPQPSLAPSQEKTKTRSWRCQLFHTGGRVQNAPNFQKFATIQHGLQFGCRWLRVSPELLLDLEYYTSGRHVVPTSTSMEDLSAH